MAIAIWLEGSRCPLGFVKQNQASPTGLKRPVGWTLMPKTHGSRLHGVQTYKANCLNNKLQGYKSLKNGDENPDFGHILMGKLDGYEGPVIIKVFDNGFFTIRKSTHYPR